MVFNVVEDTILNFLILDVWYWVTYLLCTYYNQPDNSVGILIFAIISHTLTIIQIGMETS